MANGAHGGRWAGATLVGAVSFGLLSPALVGAEVLWRGDFETGDTSQFDGAQSMGPDRLQVVTSPVRQGSHALRVEVRQGDDPINASGNRNEWSSTTTPPRGASCTTAGAPSGRATTR